MSELEELTTKESMLQRLLPQLSAKEKSRAQKELSAIRQQIGLFKALGFEAVPEAAPSSEEPNSAA